ncbi:MAG: SpoIIE family protein phosphatase [Bacillota bacterium]
MTGESFIDVDHCQKCKNGQVVSGDMFLTRKIKEEGRIISVLSDGLGSGVKASVLANLTAAMAIKYTSAFVDVRKSAKTIMDTLPICEVRKISYSTFTIVDLDMEGQARFIEHGNPPLILLRGSQEVPLDKATLTLEEWKDRFITYAGCQIQLGDRIICFSDGVSQSGMGQVGFPLGWGQDRVLRFIQQQIQQEPEMSAHQLAQILVQEACANDGGKAKDDITCSVIHFRNPRRLLVITGPPFSKDRDAELAHRVRTFRGRKAICGGTTATIIARILEREITMDLTNLDPDVPPASRMEGADLITEGTLTLAKVADLLEVGPRPDKPRPNAADELVRLMLESDVVHFVVGTRINEAHQDPNIPVELDLRRNIVRKITTLLETKYLRETEVQFM